MKTAKYFTDAEFRRCNPPCSIEDMEKEFLDLLDSIREDAGIPIVLNSAYRSKKYEISKGRAGTSSHTYGLAVDAKCGSDASRYKILNAAIKNGVTRIGLAKTYIHLDISSAHKHEVVWMY